jgi:hypothetical protein
LVVERSRGTSLVAGTPQIGRETNPVVVHIERQRGRRRVVGQLPRHPSDLSQGHAITAELFRSGHQQITSVTQFLEVLLKEAVLPVVLGRPLVTTLQEIRAQGEAGSSTQLRGRQGSFTRSTHDSSMGMVRGSTAQIETDDPQK